MVFSIIFVQLKNLKRYQSFESIQLPFIYWVHLFSLSGRLFFGISLIKLPNCNVYLLNSWALFQLFPIHFFANNPLSWMLCNTSSYMCCKDTPTYWLLVKFFGSSDTTFWKELVQHLSGGNKSELNWIVKVCG